MESIDRLLAELRAEYQASQKNREVASQSPLEAQQPSQPAAAPSNQTLKTADVKYPGNLDKDLAEIKAEYAAQNKAREVAAQEPLKPLHEAENKAPEVTALAAQPSEKIVQSESDVQTHRQKVRQAQVWLKNLDKNSDERYWFDQFAFKYSSRIDAAIDYLQAVNEFD
ncbi:MULTISPECIES: salt stress protein, Slr1339 family [unclassified Microcoleus]|uniref:salt stress protein, Slr1339 family n=1 Tax=unclassified Microcoleus TaxID=2642155 RepID=UPI002FD55FA6